MEYVYIGAQIFVKEFTIPPLICEKMATISHFFATIP